MQIFDRHEGDLRSQQQAQAEKHLSRKTLVSTVEAFEAQLMESCGRADRLGTELEEERLASERARASVSGLRTELQDERSSSAEQSASTSARIGAELQRERQRLEHARAQVKATSTVCFHIIRNLETMHD